jgi:hypothetical protein
MIWTITVVEATCGRCGDRIFVDQPVALITAKRLPRCRSCAVEMFGQVDEREIEAAREQRDANRARDAEPPSATLSNTRPTYRPRPKAPTEFAKLGELGGSLFDPKAAAAGKEH